jgi:hypothetical protein
MLFKVHSDIAKGEKDFFDLNEGAKALEEFNMLSSRQMFFVCLVADEDYDSPLRTLQERVRREKAVVLAGWPLEDGVRPDKNGRNLINGKVETVEKAIARYREIQYDEDRALYNATDAQLKSALDFITMDKNKACTVTKINKKTSEESTYVDMGMVAKMNVEAAKVAATLPILKEAKTKLAEKLKITSPLHDIITHTAQDFDDSDYQPDEDSSTIDIYMEKQRNLKDAKEDSAD